MERSEPKVILGCMLSSRPALSQAKGGGGEGGGERERQTDIETEYLGLAMMVAYAYNLGTWKAEAGLKAKDSVGYKQTFLGN